MTPNERAYELLCWQAIAPLAEYQETLDYVTIQRQRSDIALDQWDEQHPKSSSPELEAFRELERMGCYSQHDYYSPSKAADGFYIAQLQQIRKRDHKGDRQRFRQGIKNIQGSSGVRRKPHSRS